MNARHPEACVDHKCDVSATVFFLSPLLLQVDLLFEVRRLHNFLQRWSDPRIKRLEVRMLQSEHRPRRLETVDGICHLDFFFPWHCFRWVVSIWAHFSFEVRFPMKESRPHREFLELQLRNICASPDLPWNFVFRPLPLMLETPRWVSAQHISVVGWRVCVCATLCRSWIYLHRVPPYQYWWGKGEGGRAEVRERGEPQLLLLCFPLALKIWVAKNVHRGYYCCCCCCWSVEPWAFKKVTKRSTWIACVKVVAVVAAKLAGKTWEEG